MRARNLKPGFFTNEDLLELDPLTRLLFAGLWCEADRAGRLEDRPKRLKLHILPGDDCDVDGMLAALAQAGFIRRYTVDGLALIEVCNFLRHQNPHAREADSELPAPRDGQTAPDDGDRSVATDGGTGTGQGLPSHEPAPARARAKAGASTSLGTCAHSAATSLGPCEPEAATGQGPCVPGGFSDSLIPDSLNPEGIPEATHATGGAVMPNALACHPERFPRMTRLWEWAVKHDKLLVPLTITRPILDGLEQQLAALDELYRGPLEQYAADAFLTGYHADAWRQARHPWTVLKRTLARDIPWLRSRQPEDPTGGISYDAAQARRHAHTAAEVAP